MDVSENDMDTIAERAFHNVTKLQTLELGSNRLDNFPTRTFVPLMDLRTFSAPRNRLPYIPVAVQGLRKVEGLDLAGNLFERLKEKPESRAVMLSVDEVRIAGTNLSTISPNDFDLFPYLRRLYLGGNRLSRVAPYAFRKERFTGDFLLKPKLIQIGAITCFVKCFIGVPHVDSCLLGPLGSFSIARGHFTTPDCRNKHLTPPSPSSLRNNA